MLKKVRKKLLIQIHTDCLFQANNHPPSDFQGNKVVFVKSWPLVGYNWSFHNHRYPRLIGMDFIYILDEVCALSFAAKISAWRL